MTTTAIAPIVPLGELLATDASIATTSTARCCLCNRTVLHGERYAILVRRALPAHVHCIGRMATLRRGVPAIG